MESSERRYKILKIEKNKKEIQSKSDQTFDEGFAAFHTLALGIASIAQSCGRPESMVFLKIIEILFGMASLGISIKFLSSMAKSIATKTYLELESKTFQEQLDFENSNVEKSIGGK